MSKHTPGPAKRVIDWGVDGLSVWCDACEQHMGRCGGCDEVYRNERLVCARLIAAAPELLEALEYLLENTGAGTPMSKRASVVKARAAIAKATGEGE